MTYNPYEARFPATSQSSSEPPRIAPPRPAGITILAVLHLIGGVLLVGAQVLVITNLPMIEESLSSIGIPMLSLIVGIIFLTLVTIGSGIGMWLGTKWGWWLAAFYYVYSIFRNGSALVMVVSMAEQLEASSRGPEYYLAKHGGRMVVSALLLLYFFKANVLEYFGLESLSKGKAISLLVTICIVIAAATTAASLMTK